MLIHKIEEQGGADKVSFIGSTNEAEVAPCASHTNLPKQSLHITVAEDKMKTNDVGVLEAGGEGTAKVSRSKDLSEASKLLNSSQVMSGSVSSSKWRELLISKTSTVESAKECGTLVECWGWCVRAMRRRSQTLRGWNQRVVGDIGNHIHQAKEALSGLDVLEDGIGLNVEEVKYERIKEQIQCQQSRISWLKNGDCNSSFFHNSLSRRKRKNTIHGILVKEEVVSDVKGAKGVIRNHFVRIFDKKTNVKLDLEGIGFDTITEA
ncbi:hypothetical protein Fmac_006496 [Flemingia macrophylla]|uniref:Uncharacterized protein n=1 Tax=Flemingia macrophylla TaxID=520843 RepID=A0ABD1NBB3_9FABA